MFKLALQSFRYHTGAFLASFVALFLGATIVMTFASMLDTSTSDAATATDQETLIVTASVVGGFGLVIVIFAVTSTLSLSIRQRSAEMAVLKNVGATPAQITRMITEEAAIVAIIGGMLAILPAMLGGWLLLEMFAATDQISADLPYRFGPLTLAVGLGINLVAATVAAVLAARPTARLGATDALVLSATETPRLSKKRITAAVLFLAIGINLGVITAIVFRGEGYDAMQTAGQASIWASIGFAFLAPALVRTVTAILARPSSSMTGASRYLAVVNLRQRSHQMASVVMPIILFTGISTGTLYMQSIENTTTATAGGVKSVEQQNIETLNYVVVGMIVLFAAIMLINTLIAATTYRGREFGQLRLIGSTPRQVFSMVTFETIVLCVTGVLFGSIASLATVVPYSIARTSLVVPDSPIAIYLGIVTFAGAITLICSLTTTQRVIRAPAVEAVAA